MLNTEAKVQNWRKLGLIAEANPELSWCQAGMGACFAKVLDSERVRLFVGGRSEENISRIGYIDIKISGDSHEILEFSSEAILDIGEPGCFDERGVSYPWLAEDAAKVYLYYTGWVAGGLGGFQNYLGLAISEDAGKSFKRVSNCPILERNDDEPYGNGSVAVYQEAEKWIMYYTCFNKWQEHNGKLEPFYHIRYAESQDGINWQRKNKVSIDFKDEKENIIGKPMVLAEDGIKKIYYSYRSLGETYRIGYAESQDGDNWHRKDELVNLSTSDSGWDSDMVEYAFPFDLAGRRYMIYNGNAYGKAGLGLAVLEQ